MLTLSEPLSDGVLAGMYPAEVADEAVVVALAFGTQNMFPLFLFFVYKGENVQNDKKGLKRSTTTTERRRRTVARTGLERRKRQKRRKIDLLQGIRRPIAAQTDARLIGASPRF